MAKTAFFMDKPRSREGARTEEGRSQDGTTKTIPSQWQILE